MSNPVGRPSDYRPEYCEQVIAVMREGMSLTAFAGGIGVSRATINNWMQQKPEFLEAVNVGKASAAAWYNLQAKKLVEEGGSSAQSTLIVFGLKNMDRDEWKEKQEFEHSGTVQHKVSIADMTDDELANIAAGRG